MIDTARIGRLLVGIHAADAPAVELFVERAVAAAGPRVVELCERSGQCIQRGLQGARALGEFCQTQIQFFLCRCRPRRAAGKPIGICGQAPSDYPDFAQFLVEQGIDSISLNPDTVLKTTVAILEKEKALRHLKDVGDIPS